MQGLVSSASGGLRRGLCHSACPLSLLSCPFIFFGRARTPRQSAGARAAAYDEENAYDEEQRAAAYDAENAYDQSLAEQLFEDVSSETGTSLRMSQAKRSPSPSPPPPPPPLGPSWSPRGPKKFTCHHAGNGDGDGDGGGGGEGEQHPDRLGA